MGRCLPPARARKQQPFRDRKASTACRTSRTLQPLTTIPTASPNCQADNRASEAAWMGIVRASQPSMRSWESWKQIAAAIPRKHATISIQPPLQPITAPQAPPPTTAHGEAAIGA